LYWGAGLGAEGGNRQSPPEPIEGSSLFFIVRPFPESLVCDLRYYDLCDGGGSNPAGKHLFKCDLQNLANAIKLPIRIAHFPNYCSKYNPIERRFFPHIGRACEEMLFDSLERVVDLMRRAKTRKGLRTTVNIIEKTYEIGRLATDAIKKAVKFRSDVKVPKWNYTIRPECATK